MGTGNTIDVHMSWFMNDGTYQPEYLVDSVFLSFDLHETQTKVSAEIKLRKNPKSQAMHKVLFLNGQNLKLLSIAINNTELLSSRFWSHTSTIMLSKHGMKHPVLLNC